ncbi:MAG: DNA/RNA non-specific endonuclease [Alphaproteobacteria bacterium]|nr:DNA/RNA non-specific endonuclease [Alphaproteobacteria bacterium]
MNRHFMLAMMVLWSWTAIAEDIPLACQDMLREIGAPRYMGPPPEHRILCRRGFVLSYNPQRKTPDWVVERLTPERLSGPVRDRGRFVADPDLAAAGQPHAMPADYARQSRFDRGHMAPGEDMRWDETALRQSFYLSNVVPQVGVGLNRGAWRTIEIRIRRWAARREAMVVITGPIYGAEPETIGPGAIAVPDGFFKIVYDPARDEALAFRLPNRAVGGAHFSAYQVAVREIEAATGLDFFALLAPESQDRIESPVTALWPN